jgi:hypothetical protein
MSAACPHCGARNAERAPWCTQCYQPLGAHGDHAAETEDEQHAAVRERSHGGGSVPADAPAGTDPTPVSRATAASTGDRDVRQDEHGGVEWRCATCDGWSPLAAPTCAVCGAARRGFGEDRDRGELEEQRLVLATGLLPGLGHLQAGRVGSGIARAVFAVGWLVGGLLLLVAALRAGSGIWAATPLLAGAAVVWALSILDARSLARGVEREHLDGRTLLWLMVGVTCLLVVALLLDAWRLAG